MINSTSESLKDSASKVGFRLMAFWWLCSGNWPARTQKLQSHDCLRDCRPIVFRKIYISVYMISVHVGLLSLALRLNYTPYVKAINSITSSHAVYSSCQEYSSTRTAVVRSPWLVRPSGTHSATTCVIQSSASPASVACWRRSFFSSRPRPTRCTERMEAWRHCIHATYRLGYIIIRIKKCR